MVFLPALFGAKLTEQAVKKRVEGGGKGGFKLLDDIGLPGITAKGAIIGTGGKVSGIHYPYATYQPTITTHAPYEVYAPEVQYAPVTTYGYQGATYIIGSPGAESTKKQTLKVTSKPEQTGAWDIPIIQSPHYEQPTTETRGMNITHIAIIAVIGAAGIMLIKKKK